MEVTVATVAAAAEESMYSQQTTGNQVKKEKRLFPRASLYLGPAEGATSISDGSFYFN